MRKSLRIVFLLLVMLAITGVTGFAQSQSKSWDARREHLYSINAANDGHLTVVDVGEETAFGWYHLLSEENEGGDEMGLRGVWTFRHLEGDDLAVYPCYGEAEPGGVGDAGGNLWLEKGAAGQNAVFELTFTSDQLENPVSRRVHVRVISADDRHPTDYVYAKTVHSCKTGEQFTVEGGRALPAGIEAEFPISFELIPWGIPDGRGYAYVESDGSLHGSIYDAGTYEVSVLAFLTDNLTKEIVHTFEVTGPSVDGDLPDFALEGHDYAVNKLYSPDASYLFVFETGLWDPAGRRADELIWSVKQTAGAAVATSVDSPEPWIGVLYAEQALDVGVYQFDVTITDKTRGESDTARVTLTVKSEGGEVLPDGIYYDNIKPVTKLKLGKTLTFGAPRFTPGSAAAPGTHSYYLWIEGDLSDDQATAMIREDHENGRHTITAVQEGEYAVHVGIDMYDGTRDAEMSFKLVVAPASGMPVESVVIAPHGDWDAPYAFPISQKLKLSAAVAPANAKNKKITWVSGNPAIATVSKKGVVTGLIEGECVDIYAYAADGKGAYDHIVAYVGAAEPSKIALAKKMTVKVDQYVDMAVKFTPADLPESAKRLIWISDNSEVVEIDRASGRVFAKAPGVAAVHVYAADRDGNIRKRVSAKCVVTVR